jgi:hypothetical protein
MEQAVIRGGTGGQKRPVPTPPSSGAIRIAFVGQATFFEACALGAGHQRLEPTFVEFRMGSDAGALLNRLHDLEPHIVLVFRPEIIPAGAFEELPAATLGFLTEPLPRASDVPGAVLHEDLERRLWELRDVDAGNFDRVVAFDPYIAQTADSVLPVWRSLPLPVADRYYRPVPATPGAGRPVFIGRSTPHRERILIDSKHQHDLLHLAFGVDADRLEELLASHDVGINAHNEPYPSFENRVCLHLAAGHLVFSEQLSPTHGLEPGIDYLVFRTGRELAEAIATLRRFPGLWHRVRVRGRRKAEQFRASRVYRRLFSDLYADLAAFGTERR